MYISYQDCNRWPDVSLTVVCLMPPQKSTAVCWHNLTYFLLLGFLLAICFCQLTQPSSQLEDVERQQPEISFRGSSDLQLQMSSAGLQPGGRRYQFIYAILCLILDAVEVNHSSTLTNFVVYDWEHPFALDWHDAQVYWYRAGDIFRSPLPCEEGQDCKNIEDSCQSTFHAVFHDILNNMVRSLNITSRVDSLE